MIPFVSRMPWCRNSRLLSVCAAQQKIIVSPDPKDLRTFESSLRKTSLMFYACKTSQRISISETESMCQSAATRVHPRVHPSMNPMVLFRDRLLTVLYNRLVMGQSGRERADCAIEKFQPFEVRDSFLRAYSVGHDERSKICVIPAYDAGHECRGLICSQALCPVNDHEYGLRSSVRDML